ncbi:SirN-like methyltransferase [Talaromyces pinophilus]|uniref:SirN-like methyltransferase n=1 Tax=Talaromyces pinophilus TaxID=128442 RepID=A0A510NWR5_TALPI|nr:SirN-like methyltransferase [Talaromyces pinophilus]
MPANMTAFMDKTKKDANNATEQVRLEDQHGTVVAAMEGRLLYARSVQTGSPDSGLCMCQWPLDRGPSKAALPAEHDYIGTDVVKSLYPKPPPKGTHFQDQSIKEPFPSEWQETFEVVHQRLVMAAAAPKQTPGFIVQNLVKLLKPVGWLQLVEVITTPVPENPIPRNQHIDMLDSLYKNLYSGTKYAKANLMADLPWEMEKSGLRNVQQAEVLVKYGAATENLWIREKSLRTAVAGVPNFLTVLKEMPGDVWKQEWNDLPQRHHGLYKDLAESGGYMSEKDLAKVVEMRLQ